MYSSTTEYQRTSLTILPTENYNLPFMGHKIPYLSSLLVTCHQSSRLYGVNKVIFSKLIFSFKMLMYCSCENVACFLCLLIILKWTPDYFYDGQNRLQLMQWFDSVREKGFNLNFCTRNRNYIQSIESDCRSIIQGL